MKYFLIIIFLIPTIALGETIYTDYVLYLENSDDYYEETELIKREEYKIYNTYKEELEEEYMSLDNEKSKYYQIDYNDYIYKSENSLNFNQYATFYQTKCLNENYLVKDIKITNFSKELELSETKLINTKNSITLGIKVTNFKGIKSYITDNIQFGKTIKLDYDSTLSFIFFKYWELKDFVINLYFPNQDLETTSLKLTINDEIDFIIDFNLVNEENNILSIHFDDYFNEFVQENNFLSTNNCISYYNLETPYYKHSKTNLIKLNKYLLLNNIDKFLIDDYKVKYNYYKREKLVLEDNINLINEEFNLSKYIESSTIPIEELEIEHNINYEKEGMYYFNVYYHDQLLLEKNIYYSITSNNLKEENYETTTQKEIVTTNVKQQRTNKTTKTTTQRIKKLNNKITTLKENKHQKAIFIISFSTLIIILTIFEIILLYVKRKYF